MKKFWVALIILFLLVLMIYYFFPYKAKPTRKVENIDIKAVLLPQINEYEQEINMRKQKAHCDNPKNTAEFECMYGAVEQALSNINKRYKTFYAYHMWIQEEYNCDRKTGVCTMVFVMPNPKDMRESLDRYVQFCTKHMEKCNP